MRSTIQQTLSALLCASAICSGTLLVQPQQCADDSSQHVLSDRTAAAQCLSHDDYSDSVWSHRPFCVSKSGRDYCAYTTSKLRDDRGLSIIATLDAATAISSSFTFTRSAPHVSEAHLVVKAIPRKGYGLITTQKILKGSTILLDAPRIIASSAFPAHIPQTHGTSLFKHALSQLPEHDRASVLSLDQSLGGATAIEDVMKTNAFACQLHDGGADDAYMCLFPSVARINHACKPNAHARFVPKSLLMEIKALRDIKAGEEISISYGRIELEHAERQNLYKEGWNFECSCEMCTSEPHVRELSDQRRFRFTQLRKQLENLSAETYDAQQIVAWESEVMELSKQEGLDVLLAPDYERLAYVFAGHGMVRDARVWANKARECLVEWTVVDGGPRNEIERVEELIGSLGT